MDENLRRRMEEKFAKMTQGDWDKLREDVLASIRNDPETQRQLRIIERSEITTCSYYSGNALRFPQLR